ncbi:glycosyltransferase family 2 protein [Streptomyces sp. NPDC050560]|uniref:glycosyltransferase family 2 protein n=1 Tax=Streptomyces sp. NPDC050560 TaxID=3365630 RepID=UPI00379F73EE
MTVPEVSVVIGAYEAMPYLVTCLESVEAQTLPAGRMEIIAVDDGSTDGTGAYLEEFAARTAIPTRVIRQANSGGPSGPRNVGLDLARGRFVFFLDADDRLGPEAFERMVAMADRNGTDVVLGKVEGVNRGAPKSMFGENRERTDVFSSPIRYSLSAQKLFRRSLLTAHGLRFDTSLTTGEDALFTMDAYLRADGVSVVADHVCYYLVRRDDGKHATRRGTHVRRFDSARALMGLIAERVPPGPKRDLLLLRPFTVTLLPQFGKTFLKDTEDVRQEKLALAKPLMDAHFTPGLARRMKVLQRLQLHLVAEGRTDLLDDVNRFVAEKKAPEIVLADDGRGIHLAYPHFRDPAAGIPDSVYLATVRETVTVGPRPSTTPRARGVRAVRRLAGRFLRRGGPPRPPRAPATGPAAVLPAPRSTTRGAAAAKEKKPV